MSASLSACGDGTVCIGRTAVLGKSSRGTGQGWKALVNHGQGTLNTHWLCLMSSLNHSGDWRSIQARGASERHRSLGHHPSFSLELCRVADISLMVVFFHSLKLPSSSPSFSLLLFAAKKKSIQSLMFRDLREVQS